MTVSGKILLAVSLAWAASARTEGSIVPRGTSSKSDLLRAADSESATQREHIETPLEALPTAEAWSVLVARDKRVGFTERTASDARTLLALADLTAERRALALVAIGAAGAITERGDLERIAKTGEGLERKAAILALGEMGATQAGPFDEWIAKAEKPVAECALLALLRGGGGMGRRRVEEIAGDGTQALSNVAQDLLVFAADPTASRPTRAGALLLRLRWQAARQLGLVDGRAWTMLTINELAAEPRFVREVVLGATPHLRGASVKDHVQPELLGGQGPARLRTAVAVMPRELSDLVENDLWKPSDPGQWSTVLDEIDARHFERLTLGVLRAASEVPEVRYRAVALLSLAGDEDLAPLIGLDTSKLTIDERLQVCAAIGARDDVGWLTRFAGLREDRDPRVRIAFNVAAMRLGNKKAVAEVEGILADADHADHALIVEALCTAARDPAIAVLLEDRLPQSDPRERVRIATALCLQGRIVGRPYVRAALSALPSPRGADAVRLVHALSTNTSAEDVEVFHALFPTEDDRPLDLALATALAELGDVSVLPVLRAAIWSKEWDLSLLAAGLVAESQGVRALREELRVPPPTATSKDLRRLGFAIGEWGGEKALEDLARELRYASGNPALQGALLGVLATRTQ